MYVIKTNDAARMVAEEIRDFVLTDEDLKFRCKGECSVVVGLEPLCREARKQLNADRLSVDLGEAKIKFPVKETVFVDHSRKAFSGLYACVVNSHTRATMSSYVSGENASGKRGCLGFDITKMRRFFKKEKRWARYYVAVQIGGVSDIENESFARLGVKLLYGMIEEMKLVPLNCPIKKTEICKKASKRYDERILSAAEVFLVAD